MKTALFNRFHFDLPDDCVTDCAHQGPCDDDVSFWSGKLDIEIPPDDLIAELSEYGAWEDDDLQDHDTNIERIIWLGAWKIREEEELTQ
jgi:hypothetical protein